MGEIKGQLLSVLLALTVFGVIGSALYAAYNTTKQHIVDKTNSEMTSITTPTQAFKGLLSFRG